MPAILGPSAVRFYPDGQYRTAVFGLLSTDGSMAQSMSSLTAIIVPHLVRRLCVRHDFLFPFRRNVRMNFIPSHSDEAFGTHQPLPTLAADHPGFILQSVTSFHRPGFHHYYGIVCHLALHRKALSFLLYLPYPTHRPKGLRQYEASPVTSGSL